MSLYRKHLPVWAFTDNVIQSILRMNIDCLNMFGIYVTIMQSGCFDPKLYEDRIKYTFHFFTTFEV